MRIIVYFFMLLIVPASVRGEVWANPTDLSTAFEFNNQQEIPVLDVNSSENAVVAWYNTDSGQIQAAIYRANTQTWTTTTLSVGINFAQPAVAIDPAGNAVVVWFDSSFATYAASTFNFGTNAWSGPSSISSASIGGIASLVPSVGVDARGNVIAVFDIGDGLGDTIIAAARTNIDMPVVWLPEEPVHTGIGNFLLPEIAINAAGQAVVRWFDDDNHILEAATSNTSTPGSWSSSFIVASGVSSFFFLENFHQLAIDPAGNAIAVFTNLSNQIQASRFNNQSQIWSPPLTISDPVSQAEEPGVSMDAAGNAIAIWVVQSGPNGMVQVANYDQSANAWSSPITIDQVSGEDFFPQIALDPEGDAIAIWSTGTSPTSVTVKAATFSHFSNTWSPPVVLPVVANGIFGQVGVDAAGNGVASWLGLGQIDAFFLNVDAVVQATTTLFLPPTDLTGQKKKVRFPIETERFNLIQWELSPSYNVAAYNVRRNGVIIATLPFNATCFEDHHPPKNGATYTVTAVDELGHESAVTSVTIAK